ncbi:MAG: acyl-CoA dehydrogenase family protein [Chloroflexi bacterium]|nr:acyl-CoA dehydrogenase family protein [Chloroflexota bacterium]
MDFQLSEEQRMLRRTVRELAEREFRPHVAEWENNLTTWNDLHRRVMRILAGQGILGLAIPEEYGGAGASVLDYVLTVEEIAKVCYFSASVVQGASGNNSQPILHLGTDYLRKKYLPRIAQGELLGAISMTEPGAGSDLGNIKTMAKLDGDYYRLTGQKVFNSHCDIADYFVVVTRFSDRPGLAGVGVLLIDRDTPGVSFGGVSFNIFGAHEVNLYFDNCQVPKEQLLVPEGEFRRFLGTHNHQRCGSCSNPLGVAEGAFEDALKYARERVVFGRPLCDLQGIQWMFADMATRLEAARWLLYRAATNVPLKLPSVPMEVSMAKAYVNETAVYVVGDSVQVMGAYGVSREYPMERRYRFVKAMGIAGGTIQILRNAIAHQIVQRQVPLGPQ